MPKDTLVSFRLEPKLKNAVQRQMKRDDLSFSDVVRILLKGYASCDLTINVTTNQKRTLKA